MRPRPRWCPSPQRGEPLYKRAPARQAMTMIEAPSPTFDERSLPVSMIVLHYTGMKTGEAAIARLRDAEAGVSAHYVVAEDGTMLRLVDEGKRAWHAGKSLWRGIADVNSASVGLEIDRKSVV